MNQSVSHIASDCGAVRSRRIQWCVSIWSPKARRSPLTEFVGAKQQEGWEVAGTAPHGTLLSMILKRPLVSRLSASRNWRENSPLPLREELQKRTRTSFGANSWQHPFGLHPHS